MPVRAVARGEILRLLSTETTQLPSLDETGECTLLRLLFLLEVLLAHEAALNTQDSRGRAAVLYAVVRNIKTEREYLDLVSLALMIGRKLGAIVECVVLPMNFEFLRCVRA